MKISGKMLWAEYSSDLRKPTHKHFFGLNLHTVEEIYITVFIAVRKVDHKTCLPGDIYFSWNNE